MRKASAEYAKKLKIPLEFEKAVSSFLKVKPKPKLESIRKLRPRTPKG